LRQFFGDSLIKKGRGNGPLTPWQPKMVLKTLKGANSNFTIVGKDKTDSSFNKQIKPLFRFKIY